MDNKWATSPVLAVCLLFFIMKIIRKVYQKNQKKSNTIPKWTVQRMAKMQHAPITEHEYSLIIHSAVGLTAALARHGWQTLMFVFSFENSWQMQGLLSNNWSIYLTTKDLSPTVNFRRLLPTFTRFPSDVWLALDQNSKHFEAFFSFPETTQWLFERFKFQGRFKVSLKFKVGMETLNNMHHFQCSSVTILSLTLISFFLSTLSLEYAVPTLQLRWLGLPDARRSATVRFPWQLHVLGTVYHQPSGMRHHFYYSGAAWRHGFLNWRWRRNTDFTRLHFVFVSLFLPLTV